MVLLADEFQMLIYCDGQVRQSFLEAIRSLANEPARGGSVHTLHAMLGFGTYNILYLTKVQLFLPLGAVSLYILIIIIIMFLMMVLLEI